MRGKRVFVAGHRGMVGSALVRRLELEDDVTILAAPRNELDLRDRIRVRGWIEAHRPDCVFLAAGRVGGILANDTRPTEFLFDNLELELAVILGAFEAGVSRLVFLGSSCIYPRGAMQPITESALMTGALEPTNEWYAVAKIAGIKMVQALMKEHGARYISVMPTNLYGPGDNFDLLSSHVIPALMRKAHDARICGANHMSVWGSGTPRREFLHVDDCADAIVHLAQHHDGYEHVNIGTGQDISIRDVAELVADTVGFNGELRFDHTKPDGMPRKRLDVSQLDALGWQPRIGLRDGLSATYRWFLDHHMAMAA
ncbi:GDP-L-fucose synthase [Acuticoccus sp. 2012]|uniref:GDP-L-fucose synthase n=1 Tax=Acuticoccus mangrovi TaxID=2796142 RepID=A0A934MFH3_9HYPH|nr:GDP-L-fucose synthase [Acuticoccus mangrovi]